MLLLAFIIINTALVIAFLVVAKKKQKQAKLLLKELVQRNEELARYDMMKSEFLSMVAHEVSTPMTTIMASGRDTLDLLDESPLNIEEIKENQQLIQKKVLLIDGIITDLMDVVAIEKGRLSLRKQSVDLAVLLGLICDEHYKHMDENNNVISSDFQAGLPQVLVDPVRIEQVMLNLLSNAVRHTKNGKIDVRLTSEEGKQVVSVTDNGEGMDEETKRTAFEQYASSKEAYWRHGIGLHICHLIILAHGGEINLSSEEGQGTCVSFSILEGDV